MGEELELRGQGINLQRLVTMPTAAGEVLLASSDSDAVVQVWDSRAGELVAGPVKVDTTTVWDMGVVGLGADQHALATCGSETLALWDVATFGTDDSLLCQYDLNSAMGMAVVPATNTGPDLLVTTEKDLVRVIDPHDGATYSAIRLQATPDGQRGNRVYHPTGVRFGDGTAGFAGAHAGQLEVWRLTGRELIGRQFGRSLSFRGRMTYLPSGGSQAWLAVPIRRGIEVWDLDSGHQVARGELDIPLDVLAPVPLPGRTLVAAAFGQDRESGVLLWDPATRQPVTGLFNQHGPAFGDPKLGGVAIHAVIAVPYPDGTVRIASAGNDGAVRVSPPVDDLLARGTAPESGPSDGPKRGTGRHFGLVRGRSGDVVGIWLASMEDARDANFIEALLFKLDLFHLTALPWRVVPNTVDDEGGAFVLFGESDS